MRRYSDSRLFFTEIVGVERRWREFISTSSLYVVPEGIQNGGVSDLGTDGLALPLFGTYCRSALVPTSYIT